MSFSALELQRQLGHKYYEPVWAMLHKLRAAMGKRDSLYQLDQNIELNKGSFRARDNEKKEAELINRGRGNQSQAIVLVIVPSRTSMDKDKDLTKYTKPTQLKYIKIHVINNLKGETMTDKVKQEIRPESVVKTDDFLSYFKLSENVWRHFPMKVPKEELNAAFPWVHTMVSNAKRNFNRIYHMTSKKYLQNYLNEFCYKVNRRYFGDKLFDMLLPASVTSKWND